MRYSVMVEVEIAEPWTDAFGALEKAMDVDHREYGEMFAIDHVVAKQLTDDASFGVKFSRVEGVRLADKPKAALEPLGWTRDGGLPPVMADDVRRDVCYIIDRVRWFYDHSVGVRNGALNAEDTEACLTKIRDFKRAIDAFEAEHIEPRDGPAQ